MAKVLKRSDIDRIGSERSDITTRVIEVPEWGSDAAVMIRVLTGSERSYYENSMITMRNNDRIINAKNAKLRLCALCLIDPDTLDRLYTDDELAVLGARNSAAIERISDACLELNGMTDKEQEKIANGLEKNPQT